MRKILLLVIVLLACKQVTRAQAYEGKLEYQKTMQPVAIVELPYPQDVVDDAIKDYMAKKGFKGSSTKGFTVFRSMKLDDNDTDPSDLYFKTDRKSRKEKDITVITLLPTKASQDIMTRSLTDSTKVDAAKSFLNAMTPYLDAHNTNVQLASQGDVLKKAQKKFSDLQDDQVSLEKKIRKLQADQDQNKIDLVKQTQDMQNTVQADDNVKNKAQKRMNKLLDEQDDLRKKLRKTQPDLDKKKSDQEKQQQEIAKPQQILDAIKAKQKS